MPRPVSPATLVLIEYFRKRLDRPNLPAEAALGALLQVLEAADAPPEGTSLVSWLARAVRQTVDELVRRLGLPPDADQALAGFDTGVSDPEPFEVARRYLEAVLPELEGELADVLGAMDLDDMTAAAAAVRLGMTPSSVRVRVRDARLKVRDALLESARPRRRDG